MPRFTYHVVPTDQGKWEVKTDGAIRAWRRHETRQAAVTEALALARTRTSAQVVVHGRFES